MVLCFCVFVFAQRETLRLHTGKGEELKLFGPGKGVLRKRVRYDKNVDVAPKVEVAAGHRAIEQHCGGAELVGDAVCVP